MPPRPLEPGTGSSRENENQTLSLGTTLMNGIFACMPQQDLLYTEEDKPIDLNNEVSQYPASGSKVERQEEKKHMEEKEEEKKGEPEHDEAWETGKEAELHRTGYIAMGVCVFMFVYGKVMVESSLAPDARQNGWVMMASPFLTLVLAFLYIVGVTMVGPRLMNGRQPIKGLKKYMAVYNMAQVIFNAWIFSMLARGGWLNGYSYTCQLVDYSDSPKGVMMLYGSYWYFISKFIDFIDTIFMVANKKFNQVTPLHVIHHSVMVINMYFGVRYMPGGHSTFLCLLNSFVHVVMYLYYGLTSLGPWIRPYLWWKRHLTKFQISQFFAIIIHGSQLFFSDCPVPPAVTRWTTGSTWMFLFLFTDFYIKAYLKKRDRKNEIIPSDKRVQQNTEAFGNKTEMLPLISEEISTITRRQQKTVATPRAA